MITQDQSFEEKRLFQRFSARFPAKFKDSRDNYGTKVSLRNASAEGAMVTTMEHYFLHDNVTLEVKLPDGPDPMTLRGQVIWAKKVDESTWDLGIQFHDVQFVKMSRLFTFASKS